MAGNHKYVDGPMKGSQSKVVVKLPRIESGKCGPSADLYFILEQFPGLGPSAVHTGSKTSVPDLSNAVRNCTAGTAGD